MKKQFLSSYKFSIKKCNKFDYLQYEKKKKNEVKCENFVSDNKNLFCFIEKKYFTSYETGKYNTCFIRRRKSNILSKVHGVINFKNNINIKNSDNLIKKRYNLNYLEVINEDTKMIQKCKYCTNLKEKNKRERNSSKSISEIIKSNFNNYIILSRLHIPDGIHLLLYSSLYGYFLTYDINNLLINNELNISKISELIKNIGLFLCGSINSRIVGCIINDFCDKNFDRHVERTKSRPLANNSISTNQALVYFCIHGSLSLLTLFQFSYQTICVGIFSTLFIMTYPLLKRITHYAQVYLSLTFNLGFIICSSVNINIIDNILPLSVGLLPLSLLTIIYDTIYAHQDKNDDIKLNLKSLAIKWGDNTIKYSKIMSFNMLYLFYLTGYLFNMHYSYYILSTFNILYLYYNLNKVSLNDKQNCMNFFKKSKYILIMIMLSTLVSKSCELWGKRENEKRKDIQNEI